jgi:hypothetical protein
MEKIPSKRLRKLSFNFYTQRPKIPLFGHLEWPYCKNSLFIRADSFSLIPQKLFVPFFCERNPSKMLKMSSSLKKEKISKNTPF